MTMWCLRSQSEISMNCPFIRQQGNSFQNQTQPNCILFHFHHFFFTIVLSHELLLSLCSSERQVFLATWKDIPNDNEAQFQIKDIHLNSGNRNKYLPCMSELDG